MIIGLVKGQELKITQPLIVSDTIDYLEAEFKFKTADWNNLVKYVHFKQNEQVYDIQLIDDRINKYEHLNLSAGEWEIYLHGNEYINGVVNQRITTEIEKITVKNTGTLNGEVFPSAVPSISEQILATIGDLNKLETENKTNLVEAINEANKNGGETGNNSGGKVDDVIVDGVSVVSDKIAKINLRQTIINILIEYGLIKLDELTTEQIEAIQNMSSEINENGELLISYDDTILDFDLEIVNKELIVKTGLNVDFNINNNKELEVTY